MIIKLLIFCFIFIVLPYIVNFIKLDDILKKTIKNISRGIALWGLLFFVFKDVLFEQKILADYQSFISLFIEILFILFISWSSYSILSSVLEIGKTSKKRLPSSRLAWKILLKIFFILGTLIFILNFLGLSSKIGLAGIIGGFGVFLGLTSGVWFPSVKSGLVMLFSKAINEEDLIEVPELNIYGIINSIGLFNTIIRNEVDNHRVIVPNSKLENSVINNLSKLSKFGGLREVLKFKIGYMKDNQSITSIAIRKFLEEAFKKSQKNLDIKIDFERDIEILLSNPGDHALEWRVYYRTNNLSSRIVDKAMLYEEFYNYSLTANIGLNTPTTISLNSSSN